MIPINTITQGVQGLTSLVGGAVGQRGRKQEQASAQQAYDMRRREYEALDVSNPYANMQNTMEDLTVNTQAADFAAQQQQQALANTNLNKSLLIEWLKDSKLLIYKQWKEKAIYMLGLYKKIKQKHC
jgi:hypothetical protein